jgi:hypothetical protein
LIPCRLFYGSISPHLQQLYTGFLLLDGSGVIRLSQRRRRTPFRYPSDAPHLRNAGHAHLYALLDGDVRIHFDMHDAAEIAEGELDHCDFYFKRSYSTAFVDALANNHRQKVLPLGLNHRVLPNRVDCFSMARSLSLHGVSAQARCALRQALDSRNWLRKTPPECLGVAVRLIEDAHLRHELMRNNAAYYQSHLRPDALVRNALMKTSRARSA